MAKKVEVKLEGNTKHFVVNMESATKAMKDFRESTSRTQGAQAGIARSFQRMAAGAGTLYGPLNGVSGRFSAIATALRITGPGVVTFGAAMTALTATLTKGNRVLATTEHQVARLEGVLMATGGAAGFTADALDEMSRDIALNTLASTEGVRTAAAALATFGSITGKAFEQTLRLSQDVAEVMGTDIRGAAIQMAKAMEDPVNGLTSLRRAGVSFSAAQREQIKDMVRWGEAAEAQAMVLKGIDDQLGGVAEHVAGGTQVGAWDTLGQRIDQLAESLARAAGTGTAVKIVLGGINELLAKFDGNAFIFNWSDDKLNERIREASAALADAERAQQTRMGKMFGYGEGAARLQEQAIADLLDERARRETEANERSKAAADAEAKLAARRLQEKRDAYAKIHEEIDKIVEKSVRKREQLEANQAGLDELEKIDRRYNVMRDSFEREATLQAEEYRNAESLLEEHNARRLAIEEARIAAKAELLRAEAEDEREMMLKMDGWVAESNKARKKSDGELKDAREDILNASLDGAQRIIGSMADLYEQGSKAQRALLVVEKAVAIAQATINMNLAISKANTEEGVLRLSAIASAIGFGTQAIAGIAAVSVAGRAQGGPVYPGGKYMVGEHGPEVITVNQPGQVHKNADIGPTVNVNVVEDASRAGTVEQDGMDMSIYVNAVMGHLNAEFSSGRGIFASMENKYGLTRR